MYNTPNSIGLLGCHSGSSVSFTYRSVTSTVSLIFRPADGLPSKGWCVNYFVLTPCTACPVGSSVAQGIAGVISGCECGLGYEMATASCTECVTGKYKPIISNHDMCTDCAAGMHSTSGSSECLLCTAGKVSSGGASVCIDCVAGKYTLDKGSIQCLLCDQGKYSSAVAASSSSVFTM